MSPSRSPSCGSAPGRLRRWKGPSRSSALGADAEPTTSLRPPCSRQVLALADGPDPARARLALLQARRQGHVRVLHAARGASAPSVLCAALPLAPALTCACPSAPPPSDSTPAVRRDVPRDREDQAPVIPRAPAPADGLPVGLCRLVVGVGPAAADAAQLPRARAVPVRRARRLAGGHLLKVPAVGHHAPEPALPARRPRRVCDAGPDRPLSRGLAQERHSARRLARRPVREVRERADGPQSRRRGHC